MELSGILDDLNSSAGFAEIEASELRVELKKSYENLIVYKFLVWKYNETIVPLMWQLHEIERLHESEIAHFVASQIDDQKSIEADIDTYRQRFWAHPMIKDGVPVEFKWEPEI